MSRHDGFIPAITRCAAAIGLLACTETTAPVTLGPLMAVASLSEADGQPLPCCVVNVSGARVTIVGGALNFYRASTYVDSVFTPAGAMPRSCVQQVANGAHVARNGLVTMPDGSSYLKLPCRAGVYSVTLTQRFENDDGTERTTELLVSTGSFSWRRDNLTLMDSHARRGYTPSMSGPTITVTWMNRRYEFVAVPSPR